LKFENFLLLGDMGSSSTFNFVNSLIYCCGVGCRGGFKVRGHLCRRAKVAKSL